MDHHNKNYTTKLNVLELNDFKICQFPLMDVMHLVYLGAMLRLLSECNKKLFIDLSEEYLKLRPFIPIKNSVANLEVLMNGLDGKRPN